MHILYSILLHLFSFFLSFFLSFFIYSFFFSFICLVCFFLSFFSFPIIQYAFLTFSPDNVFCLKKNKIRSFSTYSSFFQVFSVPKVAFQTNNIFSYPPIHKRIFTFIFHPLASTLFTACSYTHTHTHTYIYICKMYHHHHHHCI